MFNVPSSNLLEIETNDNITMKVITSITYMQWLGPVCQFYEISKLSFIPHNSHVSSFLFLHLSPASYFTLNPPRSLNFAWLI